MVYNLRKRIRESVIHKEVVNTSCVCHEDKQPLIECAKNKVTFNYLSFFENMNYVCYIFVYSKKRKKIFIF